METIGNIENNTVHLGNTSNGYCFKDYDLFNSKSNQVCYIPEHGLPEDNIGYSCRLDHEDLLTFNYWDFIDIAMEYTNIDDVNNVRVQEVATAIFSLCDWQVPNEFIYAEIDE